MTINPQLAVVFPGQGSQSVGMMNDLSAVEPSIQTVFERASAVLGYDLWQIVSTGTALELNQTTITQPALLAASVAIWKLLQQRTEVLPAMLAGHSLGEYTALVCADMIDFEDAIALVAERGRCMQRAVPVQSGAMAAILGLADEAVNVICNAATNAQETVAVANFNSPGQVVVAGHKAAVERAILAAKKQDSKRAILLSVSVPSHCALMHDAAETFAETLNNIQFREPTIPVIQNVDAAIRTKAEEIRPLLLAQLYQPVQWVNSIHAMRAQNITTVIECGPGKVLTGLIKRIDRSLNIHSTRDSKSLASTITSLRG